MRTVELALAQERLPQLIEDLRLGESIFIAVDGKPVAELVAVARPKGKPVFGSAKGKIKMSEDFDDPLPDFEEYTR